MTDIKKVGVSGAMALLQSRREELMKLAAKYGVCDIRVFGSVARGEDRPDSDIDLLVKMEERCELFDLIGFKLDAEKLLNKHLDVLSEKGIHHLVRDRILSEAQPL